MPKRLDYIDAKEYIENFSYKLLSTEYINALSKLKLQCPEGHTFKMHYSHFKRGIRCPECASALKWSKPEKEIAEYIKKHYIGEVIENDRTQITNHKTGKNLELDVWLPELSKAIEYNGLHWHNNDKVKCRDNIKRKQCVEKKIELLIIEDKDWYDDKVCCLNKINELIGIL